LGISPGHSREIVILVKASKYTLGVNGYAIDTGVYSQRGPRDSRTSKQRDKSLSRMEKEYVLHLLLTSSYACQTVTSFSYAESPLSSSTTPSVFHLPA